jgi:hypothetical protein
LGARDLVDTPVHAHSIQAASQLSEGRGCSFDTGVRALSARGGQGEKAAAAYHFIGMITRLLAWVLRSHKGVDREARKARVRSLSCDELLEGKWPLSHLLDFVP